MKKELKQLFESDLLNEETKSVLTEAFDNAVEANKVEIEAEYAEKLNEAKQELYTSAMSMVEEAISEELTNVAEELADARSLEVQYAEKLQTFKENYEAKTNEVIEEMVNSQVKSEIDELKEDIEFAKQHQFGMKLFEAFRDTFNNNFGESDVDVQKELKEAKEELDQYKRKEIISNLLESVEGDKRQVVETILEGVATDKLEAKFETLRPVILKETTESSEAGGEQETPVNEGKEEQGNIVLETNQEEEGNVETKTVPDPVARRIQNSLKRFK